MARFYFFLMIVFLFLTSSLYAWEYGWVDHADGLSTGRFDLGDTHNSKDSTLFVVRIDPDKWELKALSASDYKLETNLCVREWAQKYNLVATINAGMYDVDRRTHIGLMKNQRHSNNKRVHLKYQSVIAFDPKGKNRPAKMFDLDVTPMEKIRKNYHTIIQNERLIKKPGENRWAKGGKTWWSEAAIGEDKNGNILFLYTPANFKMYDFNNKLLDLPINLVSAHHLEGGLPAQIFFAFGNEKIEFHSGYEVDFTKEKNPVSGIAIPNVIGIARR